MTHVDGRARLKAGIIVTPAKHVYTKFTTEKTMSEQDRSEDADVEAMLANEMVKMLKTLGPHTTEGVITEMRATDIGAVIVTGERYPLPRKLIQRILSYRDEFVQDGSGRWHLADSS